MKNMLVFSVILAIAVIAAGCCSMCKRHLSVGSKCPMCGMSQKAMPMAEINTAALKALIESGAKPTLVDARVGKYDDGRRIPNAINLGPEATAAEIQGMLPSKEALIVTYCVNLKCPASRVLAAKLMGMGYLHVLEYPDGIEDWVDAGNPVTQIPK